MITPKIKLTIPHLTITGMLVSFNIVLKSLYKPNPVKIRAPIEKIVRPKMLNGFIFLS